MIDEKPLPFSQETIFVDWNYHAIGGVRVSAWTDQSGNPYIGVLALNRMGKPNGLPCWYERRNFLSSIVIGFNKEGCPIKIFLDAGITPRGLHVSLQLPWEPKALFFYHERLFAGWGSEAPALGFLGNPTSEAGTASQSTLS